MTIKSQRVLLTLIYFVLLGLGISFEMADTDRFIRMLLMGGLCGSIFIVPAKARLQMMGMILAFLLLAGLENQSKYTVNYIFHLLYVVVLAGGYINCQSREFKVAVAAMAAASSYKYVYLWDIEWGGTDIGQAAVMMSITLLVAATLLLSLRLKEERNDVMKLNGKLTEAMTDLENMTLLKERNRVARELHDTLGHELTALVMKMELSKHLKQSDEAESGRYLTEAIQEGRSALKLVRTVVQAMKQPKRSNEDLFILIERFKQTTPMAIQLSTDLDLSELPSDQAHVIYRAVQEALTNAVRHSHAKHFWIALSVTHTGVKVHLTDDGDVKDSLQSLEEGFGLKAMRERVEELNGRMNINRTNGFEIIIELDNHLLKQKGAKG